MKKLIQNKQFILKVTKTEEEHLIQKNVDNYKVPVDYDNLPRNVYTLLLGRQSGDRKKIKKNPVREGVFIKEK